MLNLYSCSIFKEGKSVDFRRIAAHDQDQARVKYFNQLCEDGIYHKDYDTIDVFLPDWMEQLNQLLWTMDTPTGFC